MILDRQTTCWIVTEGKVGMQNQCLGLTAALGLAPTIKRVKLRSPWRQLSPYLRLGLRYAYSPQNDLLQAPWPDVMIACGRAAIPAALLAHDHGSFTIYVQNPVISPSHFDLVLPPQHDQVKGSNVLSTTGSLSMYRITPALLQREAEKFRLMFSDLHAPYVAVVIGGSNNAYQLTPHEMGRIAIQLNDLSTLTGASLLVTVSRRTDEACRLVLSAGLAGSKAYVWDGSGDNPYFGMLGLADAIIVTCDSVNMVSEACATGKPVYVIDLPGGSEKFRMFHKSLRDAHMTRPFSGKLEKWNYQAPDDMERIRQILPTLLEKKQKSRKD